MAKYNKAIGTAVGALIGAAVAFGLLPEAWATPENQAAIVAVIGLIGTIFAPKNVQ